MIFKFKEVITCTLISSDNCVHGDIRTPLLGGVSDDEGVVEVCVNGTYYPVSLNKGRFSVTEATVICKQLKLGNGSSTAREIHKLYRDSEI